MTNNKLLWSKNQHIFQKLYNYRVMKKILIASSNPGKIKEIKKGLEKLEKMGFEILTLNQINTGKDEPEETGDTFQKNAFIKAKFYADLTQLPSLSDDGGLIIPYLNNEPGVKSRRWLGYVASDEELVKYTLLKLKGCQGAERNAYLKVCLCFYDPKTKKALYNSRKILGHIVERSKITPTKGYPYRAIFVVEKYNKLYDELTTQEHSEINHRLIALKKLTNKIVDLI